MPKPTPTRPCDTAPAWAEVGGRNGRGQVSVSDSLGQKPHRSSRNEGQETPRAVAEQRDRPPTRPEGVDTECHFGKQAVTPTAEHTQAPPHLPSAHSREVGAHAHQRQGTRVHPSAATLDRPTWKTPCPSTAETTNKRGTSTQQSTSEQRRQTDHNHVQQYRRRFTHTLLSVRNQTPDHTRSVIPFIQSS